MKTTISRLLGLSTLMMMTAGSGIVSAQYYGGLNFDPSRYAVAAAVTDPGFFLTNTALDDRRIRYGLKLGYQLSPRVALVSRYSSFDRRDSVSPLARSYGLDLEGNVPLLAGFAVSGSAGISRLGSETSYGSGFYSGLFPSAGSRATAATAGRLGLGMAYQLNSSIGLRFDVEHYRALQGGGLGELGADHLSLGVMLKF